MKKIITLLLTIFICSLLTSCSSQKEKVVIYTSAADYRIAHMSENLTKAFPEYEFIIEFHPTSKHAAKLLVEGEKTECDIIHDLSYLNLAELDKAGILADLGKYETMNYCDDVVTSRCYLPEIRVGGAIVVNELLLSERNLNIPESYEDLLKPEYKGLISMADPKASGTAYMFLKSFVNSWGEEKAFEYMSLLSKNVLQFTSSGNAPINAVATKEVAIALGMTADAVVKINEGLPIKIIIPQEGSPFAVYGQSIVKGKDNKESVRKVFDYLVNVYNYEGCKVYRPEKIYKDKDFEVKNFPSNIKYADMSNDTLAEKKRLLDKWKY